MREWKERTKKINKPILLKTLNVSDFFGEVAILKDQPRSTSAIAVNRYLQHVKHLCVSSYVYCSMCICENVQLLHASAMCIRTTCTMCPNMCIVYMYGY